ncbi:MAG: hypothetical protein WD995_05115 [Gemmatimonadota bacterium]
MPIRTSLTVCALALVVTGCAGGQLQSDGGGPFAASADGPQTISIHVRNLNFSEATLWAVSNSGRQRLGVIGGKGDNVYRITWDFSQALQVEIDLLAGPRCTTEPLQVDPGDTLDLQIEVNMQRQFSCT